MINKLFRGDNVEILKTFSDNIVDLTVTSPPYDDIRDYEGKPKFDLHSLGEQLFRVTKDGGMVCVVMQDRTKNFGKSLSTFKLALDWTNLGFKLFECVIYQRHGRPGAWWSKRFRVDHEYILMFLKSKRPKYFDKEHLKVPAKYAGTGWHGTQRLSNGELIPIKKNKQKKLKCRGTIWKYSASTAERNKIKLQHPATFPDKLAEDLIICFSEIGDTVLDPFVGSGTTAVASLRKHRNYIGIDISQEYLNIARRLLNDI